METNLFIWGSYPQTCLSFEEQGPANKPIALLAVGKCWLLYLEVSLRLVGHAFWHNMIWDTAVAIDTEFNTGLMMVCPASGTSQIPAFLSFSKSHASKLPLLSFSPCLAPLA